MQEQRIELVALGAGAPQPGEQVTSVAHGVGKGLAHLVGLDTERLDPA